MLPAYLKIYPVITFEKPPFKGVIKSLSYILAVKNIIKMGPNE